MKTMTFQELVQDMYKMNKGKTSLRDTVENALSIWTGGVFDAVEDYKRQELISKAMDSLPMEFIATLPDFSEVAK